MSRVSVEKTSAHKCCARCGSKQGEHGWIDKLHGVLKTFDRCAGVADVRLQWAGDDCGNRIGGDRDEGCGVCLLGD